MDPRMGSMYPQASVPYGQSDVQPGSEYLSGRSILRLVRASFGTPSYPMPMGSNMNSWGGYPQSATFPPPSFGGMPFGVDPQTYLLQTAAQEGAKAAAEAASQVIQDANDAKAKAMQASLQQS